MTAVQRHGQGHPAGGDATERLGRVGVWLGALGRAPAVHARDAAAEVERLGFGTLWTGESHTSKEIFSHAGLLLAATDQLTIATGIANIWARDATATNAAANTLGEAYPGRFVLGLGASHAAQVDHRGHSYGRPLTAMREFLDAMDAARYDAPLPHHAVPRLVAALRDRMLALARDHSRGAHTYFVPPAHTGHAREVLGDDVLLVPEQAVLLDTDPSRARTRARAYMSFYLTLPNYVNNLRELGYDEDDFADGGSDRLVDAIVAWGGEEAITGRVRDHLDHGADHVAVQPIGTGRYPLGLPALRELAPALLAL